ncbi:MAG TPA: 4'-phosphopantetheinyl transferase superfamily protein [Terriglobales bacterium]|nr:4'-phosphopantetheinyl transferase superfamily protein [Terriglobales bacterium]
MASATTIVPGPLHVREYVPGCKLDPLSVNQVQVWTVNLTSHVGSVSALRELLSEDEIARADKFRFEQGRNEFTITRGLLRTLLGHYLDVAPQQLRFSYTAHGKPQLEGASKPRAEFNVSHSDGIAVIAFADRRRLGVDVEKVRLDFEHQHIAERFFSENEREQLQKIPRQDIPFAFFRCWTRKEAFIKALGEGLSHPLHQFDVELRADEPARLLSTRPDPAEAARWTLFDIPVPAGYTAALATEDSPRLA